MGCPPDPVVVTVAPDTATVRRGQTRQFNAAVTGATDTDVTWEVCDTVTGVSINEAGLLTVAPNAGNGSITVTATSVEDDTVSGTAIVTVPAALTGRTLADIFTNVDSLPPEETAWLTSSISEGPFAGLPQLQGATSADATLAWVYNAGRLALRVTGRSANYHGMDLLPGGLNLATGDQLSIVGRASATAIPEPAANPGRALFANAQPADHAELGQAGSLGVGAVNEAPFTLNATFERPAAWTADPPTEAQPALPTAVRVRTNGWNLGVGAPANHGIHTFYIDSIAINRPAEPLVPVVLPDGLQASGSATFFRIGDEGPNAAVRMTNRTADWHGLDITFADLPVPVQSTYTVRIRVRGNATAAGGFVLQGNPSFNHGTTVALTDGVSAPLSREIGEVFTSFRVTTNAAGANADLIIESLEIWDDQGYGHGNAIWSLHNQLWDVPLPACPSCGNIPCDCPPPPTPTYAFDLATWLTANDAIGAPFNAGGAAVTVEADYIQVVIVAGDDSWHSLELLNSGFQFAEGDVISITARGIDPSETGWLALHMDNSTAQNFQLSATGVTVTRTLSAGDITAIENTDGGHINGIRLRRPGWGYGQAPAPLSFQVTALTVYRPGP